MTLAWLAGCAGKTTESPTPTASDTGPPAPTSTGEDLDGDGFGVDSDCDDADPAVFPGAEELCDGIANDCDVAWAADRDTVTFFPSDGSAPTSLTEDLKDGGGVTVSRPGTVSVCPGAYWGSIQVTADVSVIGEAADTTILTASEGRATVAILGGDSVSVSGLTLTGGAGGTDIGSGLLCDAPAILLVEGVVVRGNDGYQAGGLVAQGGCDVTMRDSTLEDNHGALSGAVWATDGADLVLERVTLSNHTSLFGTVYVEGATLTLTSSEVSHNDAVEDAFYGAVLVKDGVAVFEDVLFDGNASWPASAGPDGSGGAVHCEGASSIDAVRSTFVRNSASFGGALFAEESCAVTLTDSTFMANYADIGGAVSGGVLSVIGSTFEDNAAGYIGGAIDGGTVTLEGSTISNNTAGVYGGAVAARTALVAVDVVMDLNLAGEWGGAIAGTTVTLSRASLYNNSSVEGGAVQAVQATFTDVVFDLNHGVYGGAVHGSEVEASGCTFTDNHADVEGGAVYWSSSFTATSSAFSGNTPDDAHEDSE